MIDQIRPWRLNDAEDLSLALSNKKVLDNLRNGLPFPYTVQDARAYINSMLNADRDKVYAFAITIDDKAIGSIGAFRQENIHAQTAEIGYYISEPFWGQGIGTCAVRLLCERVFSTTNIIRLYAEPFAHNMASCRILEKSGFALEGVLRKNAVKNGQIIDMKMYALIKV